MTQAPNETNEGYQRKNELFKLKEERELTIGELKELSALCRAAISHMTYSNLGNKA